MPQLEFDYKATGLRIKMLRLKSGLTQEKVAAETGISGPHISNVETGKTKVGLPTLVKIANIIGCSVDELLFDNIVLSQHIIENELNELFGDCNDAEKRFIIDVLKIIKQTLRQRFKTDRQEEQV